MNAACDPQIGTIIFLHLPRTGGTTLHRVIEHQYPADSIYTIGWTEDESIAKYRELDEAHRAGIRIIRGHMAFGMHEFVRGPSTYFTILREPVDRVISYYYFIRRTPDHYLHDFALSDATTLEEFIKSKANFMIDNGQTRMLSGKWNEPRFGECTEQILELAKDNLRKHCSVVGLTERYDETLLLLKATFAWGPVFYARQNTTARRPLTSEVEDATLRLIADNNQLDTELYRYAGELLEGEIERQGQAFVEELAKFRSANRLVSPLLGAYHGIRKRSVRAWVKRQLRR